MEWGRAPETDSGWVGAGPDDDLDERLAAEDEAAFDRGAPHVMTALGPIDPGALGVTLCGERLLWRSGDREDAADIDDRHAALTELDDAYAAGVRAVVDLGDPVGRLDLSGVPWLAERAPTHLIVPASINPQIESAGVADRLVADLHAGVAGTSLGAGAILLRPGGRDAPADALIEAVAEAQRRTGAPLLVVAAGGWEHLLARLSVGGVAPDRVMLIATAGRGDYSALAKMLETGAYVALVDLLADGWEAAARHAAAIVGLVAAGDGDRMLLASGLTGRSSLHAYGGEPGWGAMLERFPLLLMDAGLDAFAVRALLVDNPRRALTIEPPADDEART